MVLLDIDNFVLGGGWGKGGKDIYKFQFIREYDSLV